MNLKRRKSYFSKYMVILLFPFLLMVTFFIVLQKPIKYVSTFFINYASMEAKKQISTIINDSSSTEEFKNISYDDLYFVTKNDKNEIEMIDYNLVTVNEFLDVVTFKIQEKLKETEEKVILEIPFGILMNNPFFNNVGPNIPVRLKFVSSVLTSALTKLTNYGINNSLVEIAVDIEVRAVVILPMISKEIIVTNQVPISYKVITGKIPEFYGINGISKNSNIYELPLE